MVCASWGLSRTNPTSQSQNWDLFPFPRHSPAPGRVVQIIPTVKLGSGPKTQISTNICRRIAKTGSVCIKPEIAKSDALSQLIELTDRTFAYPGLAQGDRPPPGPYLARAHTTAHPVGAN